MPMINDTSPVLNNACPMLNNICPVLNDKILWKDGLGYYLIVWCMYGCMYGCMVVLWDIIWLYVMGNRYGIRSVRTARSLVEQVELAGNGGVQLLPQALAAFGGTQAALLVAAHGG